MLSPRNSLSLQRTFNCKTNARAHRNARALNNVRRGLLDQNLLAIVDVETLGRGLGVVATAVEGVVGIIHLTSYLFHLADTRLLVAEVEFEGLNAGSGRSSFACGEAVIQLEVGAEGVDDHCL